MKTEIRMTDAEMKAGINAFGMKDGSLLVIRKISIHERGTTVEGLHITGWEHGHRKTISIRRRVSSYTDACEALRREGY